MARVQQNFVVLEYVWLALIAGSAIVAVQCKHQATVGQVALAFLFALSTLFCFDVIAERRGAAYYAAFAPPLPSSRVPPLGTAEHTLPSLFVLATPRVAAPFTQTVGFVEDSV